MAHTAHELLARCTSHIVIPARLASTRLPRKLLLRETGKPLIQHTYEAACTASRPSGVSVATDHARIFDEVRRFGGDVEMTDPNAASGTDRVAEVARRLEGVDIVVNVQGDEPDIHPDVVSNVVHLLQDDPDAAMSTLAYEIVDPEEYQSPADVKVVLDNQGYALYFSRFPIPFVRDSEHPFLEAPLKFLKHLGIYGYRRELLLSYADLPPTPLEVSEKLEQLRALANGYRIKVGITEHRCMGIDTPEDLKAFLQRFRS